MIKFNFGGFYESIHDSLVEYAVACSVGAINEDSGDLDHDMLHDVDISVWNEARVGYCKALLEVFRNEVGVELAFVDLVSPTYYNYSTDYMIVSTAAGGGAIIKYIRENDLKELLREHVRLVTTAEDGYIPTYSYEEIFKSRVLLLECCCDVIIKYMGDSYPFCVEDYYYD